jgi:hypothetical protein
MSSAVTSYTTHEKVSLQWGTLAASDTRDPAAGATEKLSEPAFDPDSI